ncbi:IFNA3 protein, partial [Atractosteus spatula]|nr:IFNA3 protein [Atractosteus spatula]
MALQKLVTLSLVLFLSVETQSLKCTWLEHQLGNINDKSIQALEKMGGDFPVECVSQIITTFPMDAFKTAENVKNEDIVLTGLETMRCVHNIFNKTEHPATWEISELERFQGLLYRQIRQLTLCAGSEMKLSGEPGRLGVNVVLKTSFAKLEKVLRDKDYSYCAWESVRTDLRRALEQFQEFLESNKK